MGKMRALGTSLSYLPTFDSAAAVTVVGALTSVGEITPDSEELDATTLDSAGGYREFLQGFKDSGELTLTGYHDKAQTGQATMRSLYDTGALGYFWVTFPDGTTVAFRAYVKSYTTGAADVDGIVGFGCSLRISGLVQVIQALAAEEISIAPGSATLDATANVITGTPSYQWHSNDTNDYNTPTVISGATSATYTTPELTEGTYYYFCTITVAGYRPVNSGIFRVVVA